MADILFVTPYFLWLALINVAMFYTIKETL
jgi:hypothetical protein